MRVARFGPESRVVSACAKIGRICRAEIRGGIGSRETYGYDPHGRVNQVTDVRNGTRTQTYNAADLLVSDTTPASGTGQGPRTTTRQYSTAGRLTRVTLPDGANLDLAYAPDGLLTNRSGGRQPTV